MLDYTKEDFNYDIIGPLRPLCGSDATEFNKAVYAAASKAYSMYTKSRKSYRDRVQELEKELEKSREEACSLRSHLEDALKPLEESADLTDDQKIELISKKFDKLLQSDEIIPPQILDKYTEFLNLKLSDRDIKIHVVDFKTAYPEDADVITLTAELIAKKIEDANP